MLRLLLKLAGSSLDRQQLDPQRYRAGNINLTWPRGYKTFFMLNSTEHEISPLIIVKMPTFVGILTFMSSKKSILGLSEPKKMNFFIFLYL